MSNKDASQYYTRYWNYQYDQLVNANKVPKIEDETSNNDKGVMFRSEILKKLEEEIKLIDNDEGFVPTLKEVFYENKSLMDKGLNLI